MESVAGNASARVAIVGAGGVGLVAGTLLRQRGIDADIFDEGDGPCVLPQAHVINTRTSEILDEIGAFEPLRAVAAPIEKVQSIAWVESLAGSRFGKLDLVKDRQAAAIRMAASAVHPLNVGQNDFERVVLDRLIASGGSVKYRHKVVGAAVEGARAVLDVADVDNVVSTYAYDYVLACDGAGSTVRPALGISMVGPQSLARYASAYFTADLSHLVADICGPVTFVGGPDVRGVIIGFDLDKTWAFMCVMPPDASSADFNPEVMRELIQRAIGDRSVAIELDGVGTWNMSAQVADSFRSGPFFLVGDAGHRFPPTGGLGLNTGVQDAHNLAWKLAFVLEGKSSPDILDSYAEERMPVAAMNCQHSMANAMRMADVDRVLGVSFLAPVDPAVANRPEASSSAVTGDGQHDDWAAIIEQQRPHFDSLMHEIGFVYGKPDVFEAGDAVFSPSLVAGGILPHAMIDTDQGPKRLHDLCSRDNMTLLVGPHVNMAHLPALPEHVTVHQFSEADSARLSQVAGGAMARPDTVILVRPDGHVAWHGSEADADNVIDKLSKFVRPDILRLA